MNVAPNGGQHPVLNFKDDCRKLGKCEGECSVVAMGPTPGRTSAFSVIRRSRAWRASARIFLGGSLMLSLTACPPGTGSADAAKLLSLINDKRAAVNCAAVTGDDQLGAAADRHAVDIRDHPDVFGPPGVTNPSHDLHIGSDGSTFDQRIRDGGFSPISADGEIIYTASGPPYNTPEKSIEWWMNSPGHKRQIETCAYTHAGVGLLYPGGTQWIAVVDFGAH